MVYENRIRQVHLLGDEKVVQLFTPNKGIIEHTSVDEIGDDELLVLTDQRLITFTRTEGSREVRAVHLSKVEGISVKDDTRNPKPLYQGLSIILIGVLVYLVLGTFSTGGWTAGFLGGIIGILGLIYIGQFLAWEQGGEITFHGGSWKTIFPYTNMSESQVQTAIHKYFQLNSGEDSNRSVEQPSGYLEPLEPHGPEGGLSASDSNKDEEISETTNLKLVQGPDPDPNPAASPCSDESIHRPLP